MRDLSRWRVYLLSRPRSCDDEMMRTQLGETLNATSAALGRFVQSISHNSSEETVQQLLTFCLDFQAGLSCRIFICLVGSVRMMMVLRDFVGTLCRLASLIRMWHAGAIYSFLQPLFRFV